MRATNPAPSATTHWLRELASHVDYTHFRRLWMQSVTEQAERGFLAACYERVAQRANSEGEYFLAYDSAACGLRAADAADFPPHRLVAAQATALARSGATLAAQRVLDEFLSQSQADGSVCSAQARLLRDRALAGDPAEKRRLLREAAEWAARAREFARAEGGDWAYPANQEAQFRFLAGDREAAHAGAQAVIDDIAPREASFWNETNLAEMHLLRGDVARAQTHYARAVALGTAAPGDLAANRAVAVVLLAELAHHQDVDAAAVDSWFPKPVLVVFSGHMPDAPERAEPRLPEPLCRAGGPVARALAERIARFGAAEGFSAAAPGGDILFAEAIAGAGARFTLLEPFQAARVREVARHRGQDWLERLDRITTAAVRTETISCAEDADLEAQCEYANRVMLGSAILRARHINGRLQGLALWDERDAAAPVRGGTGEFVALCRQAGVPMEILNPHEF
jgi:tetratricopeptide (TPR) repeat protein